MVYFTYAYTWSLISLKCNQAMILQIAICVEYQSVQQGLMNYNAFFCVRRHKKLKAKTLRYVACSIV
ncbi:hypothetical protein ALT721_1910010 [Alteromonas alvinellae]